MALRRVPLGHKPRGRQMIRGRRPTEERARVYVRAGPGTQKSVSGVFPTTEAGRLPTNSGGAGLRSYLGNAGATAGGPQPFAGFFRSPFYTPPVPPVAEAPRVAPVFSSVRAERMKSGKPLVGKRASVIARKKVKVR